MMSEEDPNKFFMVSLVIQQLYREILAVADENGGKLKNRAVFFADEFGTLPKIESAEMMFSASRSRRLSIVPVIQSLGSRTVRYASRAALMEAIHEAFIHLRPRPASVPVEQPTKVKTENKDI